MSLNGSIVPILMSREKRKNMKEFAPIPWTFSDISEALNLTVDSDVYPCVKQGENLDCVFSGISTDSRNIKESELFIALKGEKFDGHDFIESLIDAGIKGFVVEKGFIEDFSVNKFSRCGITIFQVDDTLKALGKLAKFQRLRSGVKLVAITGSNGKTSTRQMTAEIFRTGFNTLSTMGNFNNEIGVPLTLLQLSSDHQWAIVEMGMNHKGELEILSDIAMPDIAIVTNTAKAHLEGLGSVYDIAKAKAEIFSSVRKGGAAVINMDDKRWAIIADQAEKNRNISELIKIGTASEACIKAESIRLDGQKIRFSLVVKNRRDRELNSVRIKHDSVEYGSADTGMGKDNVLKIEICMNTPAPFMVANALLASGAALRAGLSLEEIKKGLEAFNPVSGRMSILESSKGFHIIDDTYNANPASVKGSLKVLSELSQGRQSFAVLGDMLELGEQSEMLHFQTGMEIASCRGLSRLYLYGNKVEYIRNGAIEAGFGKDRIMRCEKREIVKDILDKGVKDLWVLVKGSRGMKMEEVVKGLR